MTTWNLKGTKHHVLICNGSSCMRKGGEEATQAIRKEIANLDLDTLIHTTRTRCNGRCKDAPVVVVYPEGTWYREVTAEIGGKIVEQHLAKGCPLVDQILYQYKQGGFVSSDSADCTEGISKPIKGGA